MTIISRNPMSDERPAKKPRINGKEFYLMSDKFLSRWFPNLKNKLDYGKEFKSFLEALNSLSTSRTTSVEMLLLKNTVNISYRNWRLVNMQDAITRDVIMLELLSIAVIRCKEGGVILNQEDFILNDKRSDLLNDISLEISSLEEYFTSGVSSEFLRSYPFVTSEILSYSLKEILGDHIGGNRFTRKYSMGQEQHKLHLSSSNRKE